MPRRYTPKASTRPDVSHIAAGYVRESTQMQELGASPEVQRAQIQELARRIGCVVPEDRWESDVERGSVIERPGYQRILEWARRGEIGRVLVFSMSRWGRVSWERGRSRDELRALGVEVWSVLKGKDEPGLASNAEAMVDEEYSRMLGKVVRPNKENSARSGIFQGPTPYGYTRVYPPYEGRRRPWGLLTPEPTQANVVRDRIFARYAAGGVSVRAIARELNADPSVPPPRRAGVWGHGNVRDMLTNEAYIGLVGYNERPKGLYDKAGPDDYFEVEGRHAPIVERAVFEAVQKMLARNGTRPGLTRVNDTALLTGLLVCHLCGGPMRPAYTHGRAYTLYRCQRDQYGKARCPGNSYRMPLANRAALAAVGRLEVRAWTHAVERRAGMVGSMSDLARARREQAAAVKAHADHAAKLDLLGLDPAELAPFAARVRELARDVAATDARVRALETTAPRVEDLRRVHARLARQIGDLNVREILSNPDYAIADDAEQSVLARELLLEIVDTARLASREKPTRPRWLTLEITWADDIMLLQSYGACVMREGER